MSDELSKVTEAAFGMNVGEALAILEVNHHIQLAEALLIALASAKNHVGQSVHIPLPFELLPSICKALDEELTKIAYGRWQ